MGRFINADAYASTGQGILGNNMFAYCNNNPISRIDPSGNSWTSLLMLGLIIAVALSGCAEDEINCYTYALINETDDTTTETLSRALDPGSLSGKKYSNYILYYAPSEVEREFVQRITADAEALGYICIGVEDVTNYTPADGNWLIAVAYCPNPSQADYHFWKRHADGTWSHKPGSNEIMFTDFAGNIITDPNTCNRGRYSEFIGYFEIGPNRGG